MGEDRTLATLQAGGGDLFLWTLDQERQREYSSLKGCVGSPDSPGREWLHLNDHWNSCNKAEDSSFYSPRSLRENGWLGWALERRVFQGQLISAKSESSATEREREGEARALSQNRSSPNTLVSSSLQIRSRRGAQAWRSMLGDGGRSETDTADAVFKKHLLGLLRAIEALLSQRQTLQK